MLGTAHGRRKPAAARGNCHVCGGNFARAQLQGWETVRSGLSQMIAAEAPGWAEGSLICRADLDRFRAAYVARLLEDERGEISALDRQVLDSLASGELVSQNPDAVVAERETFGERMADGVAAFGGSWTFILTFIVVLGSWMTVNVVGLLSHPFDPYPFILLNLVLSTVAAFQAPVIMMSQRRQETKDRLRAENDYRVNLMAELEIRQLHEKIDHQMARQWEKLAELQQIQIDLLLERGGDRGGGSDRQR